MSSRVHSCPQCGFDLSQNYGEEVAQRVIELTLAGKSHQWISYELRIPPGRVRKIWLDATNRRWPDLYERALAENKFRGESYNPSPDINVLRELIRRQLQEGGPGPAGAG
jgi:hypothetical protein